MRCIMCSLCLRALSRSLSVFGQMAQRTLQTENHQTNQTNDVDRHAWKIIWMTNGFSHIRAYINVLYCIQLLGLCFALLLIVRALKYKIGWPLDVLKVSVVSVYYHHQHSAPFI